MNTDTEKELQELARQTLGEAAIKKMEHCIGFDPFRVYWRHGKRFYKPYRNGYAAGVGDIPIWDKLKEQGFADNEKTLYWLTLAGLAVLSAAERVYIYDSAATGNEVDAAPVVIQVLLNHAVYCGYGCWIPPSADSIATAGRLPGELTRETLHYLRDEGYVKMIYEGGQDDEGFAHCTRGWVLSKKWFDENQERYKAAQKAEYKRMAEIEREVGAKF